MVHTVPPTERPAAGARPHAPPSILLAGSAPVGAAGNAVSTEVLLDALSGRGTVGLLDHRIAFAPSIAERRSDGVAHTTIGVQPFSIHGEALLGGWLHRDRLRRWECAWAVNSRYAGALRAAGIPYALWEATTTRDELQALDLASIRRAGSSGAGTLVHRALLPVGERIEGWLYRGARVLLAMSEYTRATMAETHGLPVHRIEILPHPPARSFLDALAGTPPAAPPPGGAALRLLFVGRLADPRKNVPLLLDVFRALRRECPAATLTMIGPYTQSWRSASGIGANDDGITLRGRVSVAELAEAYRRHDVLVVPSRQEGFGIVVAEAMHAGLPIVSTRCGGPEQVIRESGAGLLVDDGAGMLEALRGLSASPQRRAGLGFRGGAYARAVLSPEVFAARVDQITRRLLGPRRRPGPPPKA